MSKKRQTLEVGGHGGSGWSMFYKDETGDLSQGKEILFYQTWGFLPSAKPRKEKEERWASMDYDNRWRLTTSLYPHFIGMANAIPLSWEKLIIAEWWWNWAKTA